MKTEILKKMYSTTNKVELSEVQINLGTIDDINKNAKIINDANVKFNKLDTLIQKNVSAIRDAYSTIIRNQDYEKKSIGYLDKYGSILTSQASDLGIDVKTLPAYKTLMDAYDSAKQIGNTIANSMSAVQSLGK